jgi:acyl carrier protein
MSEVSMAMFEQELRAFIAQTAGVNEERVTETAPFAELGIDSLAAVEIVCWVEKELQIEIPETAVQRVRTLRDILSAVEQTKEGFESVAVTKESN